MGDLRANKSTDVSSLMQRRQDKDKESKSRLAGVKRRRSKKKRAGRLGETSREDDISNNLTVSEQGETQEEQTVEGKKLSSIQNKSAMDFFNAGANLDDYVALGSLSTANQQQVSVQSQVTSFPSQSLVPGRIVEKTAREVLNIDFVERARNGKEQTVAHTDIILEGRFGVISFANYRAAKQNNLASHIYLINVHFYTNNTWGWSRLTGRSLDIRFLNGAMFGRAGLGRPDDLPRLSHLLAASVYFPGAGIQKGGVIRGTLISTHAKSFFTSDLYLTEPHDNIKIEAPPQNGGATYLRIIGSSGFEVRNV